MAWTSSAMELGLEEEGTSSMVSEVGFIFCFGAKGVSYGEHRTEKR